MSRGPGETLAVLCLFCLALGAASPAFSLGRKDKGAPQPSAPVPALPAPTLSIPGPNGTPLRTGDWVELSGRVRLVGSEPFPELVLTDAGDQDWYIESASRRTLQPYEQRSLTIRGKVELMELILANGYSLGIRRILSDVTVIN